MKKIQIKTKEITVVSEIIIDGKKYPLHMWNIERATKYLNDGDEKHLDNLKDFSLEF